MTRTPVYAVSSRSGLPIAWRLARATSTQSAPNSKPVGSPPCDIHRWVEPRTPPPSLKWRSGSKPWLHLTLPYLIHNPTLPAAFTTTPPTTPPIPTHTCITFPTLYTTPTTSYACTTTSPQPPPSSPLSSASAPTSTSPCVPPCPRRLKPRRGSEAALLILHYSRAAWQGVDACG
jgi:hypothetical protein